MEQNCFSLLSNRTSVLASSQFSVRCQPIFQDGVWHETPASSAAHSTAQEVSSDSVSCGNIDATQVLSRPCTNWCAFSIVVCLSRPFRLVSQVSRHHHCLCCWFSICHKHRSLQTPRFQTLDGDLDWCFRGSFLCGRSCLYCSRLFFPKREHHQHLFKQVRETCSPAKLAVSRCLFSRIFTSSIDHAEKSTMCEMGDAPACAAGVPPIAA